MSLTIELPDDLGAALEAQARAQGISPDQYVSRLLRGTLAKDFAVQSAGEPFETGFGMWASHGLAPSEQEIDKNRREMFRNFADDF